MQQQSDMRIPLKERRCHFRQCLRREMQPLLQFIEVIKTMREIGEGAIAAINRARLRMQQRQHAAKARNRKRKAPRHAERDANVVPDAAHVHCVIRLYRQPECVRVMLDRAGDIGSIGEQQSTSRMRTAHKHHIIRAFRQQQIGATKWQRIE